MTQQFKLTGQSGRLDKVLVDLMPNTSRATVQKLIKEAHVTVDGKVEKANYKLKGHEQLEVTPLAVMLEELTIEPEAIPLEIVYEDDDVLVINKPAGMVVHPSKGHTSGTLVNGLLHYLNHQLSDGTDAMRPGIVHRIDKDTSGLLVIAKHNAAHQHLAAQLTDHTMGRRYKALVHGKVNAPHGSIEVPLQRDAANRLRWHAHKDGKYAMTHFQVLQQFDAVTLIDLQLETGRTHQIRVHLEYIGHPIVGDAVYRRGVVPSQNEWTARQDGQLLHAYALHFKHPRTNEMMTFEVPLPEKFEAALTKLNATHM